jgi:hypothetical protein
MKEIIMIQEVNPKRLAEANKTSKEPKGSILVDYKNGAMVVRLTASTHESEKLISPMLKIVKESIGIDERSIIRQNV